MSNTKENDRNRHRDKSANSSYEPSLRPRHSHNGVQESDEKKTQATKKIKSDASPEKPVTKNKKDISMNVSSSPNFDKSMQKGTQLKIKTSFVSDTSPHAKELMRRKEERNKKHNSPPSSFPAEKSPQKLSVSKDEKNQSNIPVSNSNGQSLRPTEISPLQKGNKREKLAVQSQSTEKKISYTVITGDQIKKEGITEMNTKSQNKKKNVSPSFPTEFQTLTKKEGNKGKTIKAENKIRFLPPTILTDAGSNFNETAENKEEKAKRQKNNFPPPTLLTTETEQKNTMSYNDETQNRDKSPSFRISSKPRIRDKVQVSSASISPPPVRRDATKEASSPDDKKSTSKSVVLNTSLVDAVQKENIQASPGFLKTEIAERKEKVKKIQEMAKNVFDNSKNKNTLSSKSSTSITDIMPTSSSTACGSLPTCNVDKKTESIKSRSSSEPRKTNSATNVNEIKESNSQVYGKADLKSTPSHETIVTDDSKQEIQNSQQNQKNPKRILKHGSVNQPTLLAASDISVHKEKGPRPENEIHQNSKSAQSCKETNQVKTEAKKKLSPNVSPTRIRVSSKPIESKPHELKPDMTVGNAQGIDVSATDALNMLSIVKQFTDTVSKPQSINTSSVKSQKSPRASCNVKSKTSKENSTNPEEGAQLGECPSNIFWLEDELSPTDKTFDQKDRTMQRDTGSHPNEMSLSKKKKKHLNAPHGDKTCVDKTNAAVGSITVSKTVKKEDEMALNNRKHDTHVIEHSRHSEKDENDTISKQTMNTQLELPGNSPFLNLREDLFDNGDSVNSQMIVASGGKGVAKNPIVSSVCCKNYASYKAERQLQSGMRDYSKRESPPMKQRPCCSDSDSQGGSLHIQPFSIRVVGTDSNGSPPRGKPEKEPESLSRDNREKEKSKDSKKKKKKSKCETSVKPSASRSTTGIAVHCEEAVPKKSRRSRSEESICERDKTRRCTPRCQDRQCPGRNGSDGSGCGEKWGGISTCRPGDAVNGWFGQISSAIGCQLQHIAGTKGIFKPPCCTGFYRLDNSTTGWLEQACQDVSSSPESSTAVNVQKKDSSGSGKKDDEDDTDSQVETMPKEEVDDERRQTKSSQRSSKKESGSKKGSRGTKGSYGTQVMGSAKSSSKTLFPLEETDSVDEDSIEIPKSSVQTLGRSTIRDSARSSAQSQGRSSVRDSPRSSARNQSKSTIREPHKSSVQTEDKVSIRDSAKSSVQTQERTTIKESPKSSVQMEDKVPIRDSAKLSVQSQERATIKDSPKSSVQSEDKVSIQDSVKSKSSVQATIMNTSLSSVHTVDKASIRESPKPSIQTHERATIGDYPVPTSNKSEEVERIETPNDGDDENSDRSASHALTVEEKTFDEEQEEIEEARSERKSSGSFSHQLTSYRGSDELFIPSIRQSHEIETPQVEEDDVEDDYENSSLYTSGRGETYDGDIEGSPKRSTIYVRESLKQIGSTHDGSIEISPTHDGSKQICSTHDASKQISSTHAASRQISSCHTASKHISSTHDASKHISSTHDTSKQVGFTRGERTTYRRQSEGLHESFRPDCAKSQYRLPQQVVQQCFQTNSTQRPTSSLLKEEQKYDYSTSKPFSRSQRYSVENPYGSKSQEYRQTNAMIRTGSTLAKENQSSGSFASKSFKRSPCPNPSQTIPSRSTEKTYYSMPRESVNRTYDTLPSGSNRQSRHDKSPSRYGLENQSNLTTRSQSKHVDDRHTERKSYLSPRRLSDSGSALSPSAPKKETSMFMESISCADSRLSSPQQTFHSSPSVQELGRACKERFQAGSIHDSYYSRLERDREPYYRARSAENSIAMPVNDDMSSRRISNYLKNESSPERKSSYMRRVEGKCRKSGTNRSHLLQLHDKDIVSSDDDTRRSGYRIKNCESEETSYSTTTSAQKRSPPKHSVVQTKQSRLVSEGPAKERAISRQFGSNSKGFKRSSSFSKCSSRLSRSDSEKSRLKIFRKYETASELSESMTSTECIEDSNVLYSRLSPNASDSEEQTSNKSGKAHEGGGTESPSDTTLRRDQSDSSETSDSADESNPTGDERDSQPHEDYVSDGLDAGDNEFKLVKLKVRGEIVTRNPHKIKTTEIGMRNKKLKMECRNYDTASRMPTPCDTGTPQRFEVRDKTSNRRKNPDSDSEKAASFSNQSFMGPELKRCSRSQYEKAPRMRDGRTLTLSQKVIDLPSESDSSQLPPQHRQTGFPVTHLECLSARLLPKQKIDCFHQIITPEQPTSICTGERNRAMLGYFDDSEVCDKGVHRKESNFYSSEMATSITASQVQAEYDEVYSFGKSLLDDDDMAYMRKPVQPSNGSLFIRDDESSFCDKDFDDHTPTRSLVTWSKDKNASSSSGNNSQSPAATAVEHKENEPDRIFYTNGIKEAIKTFNANLLSLSKNDHMTETVDHDHMRLFPDGAAHHQKEIFFASDFIDPSTVNRDDPKVVFEKIKENSYRALMYATSMTNLPCVKTFQLSQKDFASDDSYAVNTSQSVTESADQISADLPCWSFSKQDAMVQTNLQRSVSNLGLAPCEVHWYDPNSGKLSYACEETQDKSSRHEMSFVFQESDVSNLASLLVKSIVHSSQSRDNKSKKRLDIGSVNGTHSLLTSSDRYPPHLKTIDRLNELTSDDNTSNAESASDYLDFRRNENSVTNITFEETLVINNQSFIETKLSPGDFSFGSIVQSVESNADCDNSTSYGENTADTMLTSHENLTLQDQSNKFDQLRHNGGDDLSHIILHPAGDTNILERAEEQVPKQARRMRNNRRSTTMSKKSEDEAAFNPSQFVKECLESEITKALDRVYNETFNTMVNNSCEQSKNSARSNNAIQYRTVDCEVPHIEGNEAPGGGLEESAHSNEESLLNWVKVKLRQEIGKLVSRFDWSAISKGSALARKSSLKGSSVDFCNTRSLNSPCPKIQFQEVPACGVYPNYDASCQDGVGDLVSVQYSKPKQKSFKRCSRCYQKRKTTCCHYNADAMQSEQINKSYEELLNDIKCYKPGSSTRNSAQIGGDVSHNREVCEPNNNACPSRNQCNEPRLSPGAWNLEQDLEQPKVESSVDSRCLTLINSLGFNRCPIAEENETENTQLDSSVDSRCLTLTNSRGFKRCPIVEECETENIQLDSSVDRECYQTFLKRYGHRRRQMLTDENPQLGSSVDSACYGLSPNNHTTKRCSMSEEERTENGLKESSVDHLSLREDCRRLNRSRSPCPIMDELIERDLGCEENEPSRYACVKSRSHSVLSAKASDTNMISPAYCHSAGSLSVSRKLSQQQQKCKRRSAHTGCDRLYYADSKVPFSSFVSKPPSHCSKRSKVSRHCDFLSAIKSSSTLWQSQDFKSSFMKKEQPISHTWKNEIYESLTSVSDPAEAFVRMYLSVASRSRYQKERHNTYGEIKMNERNFSRGKHSASNFINSFNRKDTSRNCSVPMNRTNSNAYYKTSETVVGDCEKTCRSSHTSRNFNQFIQTPTSRSRESSNTDIISRRECKPLYNAKDKSILNYITPDCRSARSYSNRNWNQNANSGAYDSSPQESLSDSSVDSEECMVVDRVPFVSTCHSEVTTTHRGINRSKAVIDLPSLCKNELINKPGERLSFFSTLKHLKNREKKYEEPYSEPIYPTTHLRRRENQFSDFARKNLNSSGNIIHTLSRDDLVNEEGDDNFDGSEEDFHSAEEDMASYPPRSSDVDALKPRYRCSHHVTDMCNHRHVSLADECHRIHLQDLCRNCSCLMKYCQGMKRDMNLHYCKGSNVCDGMNHGSQAMCFSNNRSEQEERNIAFPFYKTLSENCKSQPKIFKMGGGVSHKCMPNTIKDFVNWYACDDDDEEEEEEEDKNSNDIQSVTVKRNNEGVSQYLCSRKTERNENCQDFINGKDMSRTPKEDPAAHGDVHSVNYKSNKSTLTTTCDVDMERHDGDAADGSSCSSYEDTDEDDGVVTSIENLGYRMLKGVIDSKFYGGDKHHLKKSKTHNNYRDTLRRSRAPLRRHMSKFKRSRAVNRFLPKEDDSYVAADNKAQHRQYQHRDESHGNDSDSMFLEDIQVPQVDKGRVRFACDKNGEWAEVGRGSYGCVYLGLLDGEIEVAIKDFYESNSYDHVIHEARMLVYLQGTGITPKFYGLRRRFDITKQPSEYCIIMEFFGDGKTLFNVLSEKTELTPSEWLDVLGQLVAGLRLIHRRDVLINDLKADNILIDLNGARKTIRYIDVGMATYKHGLTFQLPQNQMGKYNFLAPEVRDGLHTSKRSDIYSLGYMLDQIRRFAGDSLNGLESVVAQCMREEPKKRPCIDDIVSKVHKLVKSTEVPRTISEKNCILLSNSV